MVLKSTQPKRKARPEGEERTERPTDRRYAPIGEFRDLTNIQGGNEEQVYHWFLDQSESGQRIFDAYHAGWDFVDAEKETGLTVGEHYVDRSDKNGSIIRRPANKQGEFLYLMTMPKDRWEEIQAAKQRNVDEIEEGLLYASPDDGQYGENKIKGHGEIHAPRSTRID